jgi:PKD repeat protein
MSSQTRLSSVVVLAALVLGGCTTKEQGTPPLGGPSELSTSIAITVAPDVVTQDGVSQSLVSITARDANGQPLRNASLRAEISVSGVGVDFGRLSAKSLVTDANGRASLVYTAPPAPAGPVPPTDVQIVVTPMESDFGNATARWVTIHVVPGGTTIPPRGGVTPDFTFTPGTPNDNEPVLFDASASRSTTGTIVQWLWNFDDGGTASGERVTHSFRSVGSKNVTLTVIDSIGASNSITRTVSIGQGALPTATILSSPSAPIVGQTINFNGSTSKPAPGRSIRSYDWDFGDGTTGSGANVQHAYAEPGTYVVVLTVTDDVGRVGTATASVTVTTDEPTASFTMTPNPATGTAGSDVLVFFDASASVAKGNRTIVSYSWTFSNSTTPASGRTTSHSFRAPGTYQITLTVTDSAGKTGTATQTLTVTGT